MSTIEVDTTRLPLLLQELRLPAITRLWPEFTERADKEGWPAARLLSALAELENCRARPPAHRATSRGSAAAAWQDARQLRLCRRADAQQGPCHGTRGRRCLARQSVQPAAVRPARCRQEPLCHRHRPRTGREWLSRAVHPHHGYRPEAPGLTPGSATG